MCMADWGPFLVRAGALGGKLGKFLVWKPGSKEVPAASGSRSSSSVVAGPAEAPGRGPGLGQRPGSGGWSGEEVRARGTRLAVEKMRGAREEPRTQDPEGLDLFCFLRGATWWKVRGGLKVQWRGSVRQGDLSSQGEPVQEP